MLVWSCTLEMHALLRPLHAFQRKEMLPLEASYVNQGVVTRMAPTFTSSPRVLYPRLGEKKKREKKEDQKVVKQLCKGLVGGFIDAVIQPKLSEMQAFCRSQGSNCVTAPRSKVSFPSWKQWWSLHKALRSL